MILRRSRARQTKFSKNENNMHKISQILIFENFGARAPKISSFRFLKNVFFRRKGGRRSKNSIKMRASARARQNFSAKDKIIWSARQKIFWGARHHARTPHSFDFWPFFKKCHFFQNQKFKNGARAPLSACARKMFCRN